MSINEDIDRQITVNEYLTENMYTPKPSIGLLMVNEESAIKAYSENDDNSDVSIHRQNVINLDESDESESESEKSKSDSETKSIDQLLGDIYHKYTANTYNKIIEEIDKLVIKISTLSDHEQNMVLIYLADSIKMITGLEY